jgi:hypothetical protein
VELQSITWQPGRGWSAPLPVAADPATLVLAFGGSDLADHPEPLKELADAFDQACVVGCSTAGEIVGDMVRDDALALVVARFGSTRVVAVHEPVEGPDQSRGVGHRLGRRLLERLPDLGAVLVLSDGLVVNGSELVAGLLTGTGGHVPISGGLAGDGTRFDHTWVLVDGQPRSGHVTAVGLAGPDLRVGHGCDAGWEPFGPPRRITRSAGNVLYELDGEPALALYKKYLGDRAAGLPATALLFPLTIRVPGADDRELVRTILAVDEQTQSMTFAGDVPEGSAAQLMRGTVDGLVDAASRAARSALAGRADPVLALAVSCVGRRLMLGNRVEDELEATLDCLPAGSELVGFYSYGELSPVAAGSCDLHNQTMTVTTVAEIG